MVTQQVAKQMHANDVHVQIVLRIMPRHVSRNQTDRSTAHVVLGTQASSVTSALMGILVIHWQQAVNFAIAMEILTWLLQEIVIVEQENVYGKCCRYLDLTSAEV